MTGVNHADVLGRLVALAVVLLSLALTPEGNEAQDVFNVPDPDRIPVLLVPGWGDNAPDHMGPFRGRLLQAGWAESRILAVTFRDPVGSNEEHAREVERSVQVLRSLTGADRVDVVAHSMGGLAVRHYLKFAGGDEHVRRAVFLGTPHRGTIAAMLAWGEGGREMAPGSEFLSRLNENNPFPDSVTALAIRTPIDMRVIPGSSAMLPGAHNLEICCPTHNGLADDDRVFTDVRTFLLHGTESLPESDDTIPLRTERKR